MPFIFSSQTEINGICIYLHASFHTQFSILYLSHTGILISDFSYKYISDYIFRLKEKSLEIVDNATIYWRTMVVFCNLVTWRTLNRPRGSSRELTCYNCMVSRQAVVPHQTPDIVNNDFIQGCPLFIFSFMKRMENIFIYQFFYIFVSLENNYYRLKIKY